jgi:glycosyltransferase involved in cell wall biosynthesis
MRVLQVHAGYRQTGGEDAVVAAEAQLLVAAGHEVVPFQVENPRSPVGAALALGMAPWNPTAARALRRVAEEVRPDVAHVHNTWFALSPAVLPALRRAGVPVVMTLHNYRLVCANAQLYRDGGPCEDCVGRSPWPGVRHRCYRGSATLSAPVAATIALHRWRGTWHRDVDLFLALNGFARSVLVRGGLPADRVEVKPNFTPDPGPRPQPPARARTLLYVGRLDGQKGVDVLLDAWAGAGGRRLELVVVGDGPARRGLERRGVSWVRFTGALDSPEVRALMLSARALVFPSRSYEGQPMVVLEALAAGLPVVASGLGGMPELLGPSGAGWLAEAGDPGSWVAALDHLDDDAGVDRAGRAARVLYERSFSEPVATRALVDAYRRARAAAARRRSATPA